MVYALTFIAAAGSGPLGREVPLSGDQAVLDVPEAAATADLALAAATIVSDLARVVHGFQSEICELQAKLAATRESLLRARALQRDSIQELRRVVSPDWVAHAADEI